MNTKANNTEVENYMCEGDSVHCLNCGTELKGSYCHECGQKASKGDYSIKGFILEYLNNAYMWDTQIFSTLWQLFSRPGYLTRRFISGKFISQAHPLKINMFLLFVFITFLFMFHEPDKLNKSVYDITRDESVFGVLQLDFLMDNAEYVEKLRTSPRDTVHLRASLMLAKKFPELVTSVRVYEDTKGQSVDQWDAVLPRVLIDDKYLVCDDNGWYSFDSQTGGNMDGFKLIDSVWASMFDIISNYFSLLILLTAPLLSFSIGIVQRRQKIPRLHHFIFSLHYISYLELLALLMYFAYLTVAPPMSVMQWILVIASNVYLVLAFREVYGVRSWFKGVIKALFTHVIYLLICVFFLAIIFFVACIIVAKNS